MIQIAVGQSIQHINHNDKCLTGHEMSDRTANFGVNYLIPVLCKDAPKSE